MGNRNADRISIVQRKPQGETVADMVRHGWVVSARCPVCRLETAVNLARIVREKGPAVSLWNRQAACKRVGCAGRVSFYAKAPGMARADVLVCAAGPPPKAWKRGR